MTIKTTVRIENPDEDRSVHPGSPDRPRRHGSAWRRRFGPGGVRLDHLSRNTARAVPGSRGSRLTEIGLGSCVL
jgi:hypothetical protein